MLGLTLPFKEKSAMSMYSSLLSPEPIGLDYWLPDDPHPERLKNPNWNIVGRLRPGATAARAQAELTVLSERQAEADTDFAGVIPKVQSLQEVSNRDGRSILFPLFGASDDFQ